MLEENEFEFKSINQTLNFRTFLKNIIHLTELLNVYNSNKPLRCQLYQRHSAETCSEHSQATHYLMSHRQRYQDLPVTC